MRLSSAKIFDNANLYKWFQKAVSRGKSNEVVLNELIRPEGVRRVLDFGSGIGHLANDFPAADYLGIEPLEKCVAFAKKRYGRENADFIVGDHYSLANLSNESFDLIIAIGVLHHMDDQSVKDFIKHSYRILVKGGRIVTFDPVFHKNQSILSRFVVSQDRGLWVRTPEQYINLFEEMITSALSSSIYSKLLRIPYDHFAITATKSD